MSLVPFDDRDGWIWLDGQFTPWREAKVHVLTHGLHYASAVFEGERMYGGTIFKSRAHTERLFKSAGLGDCLGARARFGARVGLLRIEHHEVPSCSRKKPSAILFHSCQWRR